MTMTDTLQNPVLRLKSPQPREGKRLLLCGLHLRVRLARSLDQSAQAQIVDDILDPLDVVLDSIGTLAQDIVLEIEYLEASEEVLDEGADHEGQVEVSEGDGVGGQAREVLG